jgi:RecA/RadA recombinase
MSMQVRVAALKQKLEQLFPGKWLNPPEKSQRYVETGIPEIDNSVAGGVARKRITEWTGPLSSGKTSVLRSAVSYWCSRGLNVAYIDTEGRLYPADWAFVEQQWRRVNETAGVGSGQTSRDRVNNTRSGAASVTRKQEVCNRKESLEKTQPLAPGARTPNLSEKGKFWIVRPPEAATPAEEDGPLPLVSKKHLQVQEAVWSADQFIRSNAFDVVILDLGAIDINNRKSRGMAYTPPPWRIYARLQRALDRSKAALILVSDLAVVHTEAPAVESKPGTTNLSSTKLSGTNNKSANASTAGTAEITNNWGCHARFTFNRGAKIEGRPGLNGVSLIVPLVRFSAWRNGMSQDLEVSLAASVPNRLFTHSQIPDRRSSKG